MIKKVVFLVLFLITNEIYACVQYYQNIYFQESDFFERNCQIHECEEYDNEFSSLGIDPGQNYNNEYEYTYHHGYRERRLKKKTNCRVAIINSADVLTSNFFAKSNHFVQMFLNNSGLSDIRRGAFNNLDELQELYLQKNNLAQLSEGVFNSLNLLSVLRMDNNQITTISNFAFEGLDKLYYLDLSFNRISSLPVNLFEPLIKLKVLYISHNPFKVIDHIELNVSKFKASNIGINNLAAIDSNNTMLISSTEENIFISLNCEDLELLDLSENNITSLNHSLVNVGNRLDFLNFSSNLIEEIDNEVFNNMFGLSRLDLHGNKLTNLPNGVFHDLNALYFLDLSQNQLKEIQHGLFGTLKHLLRLNLSNNAIEMLNFIRVEFSNKLTLDISNNQLDDLDVDSLHSIDSISLDNNKWHCKKLGTIITILKKKNIEIMYGSTHRSENIHKIACDNTKFLEVFQPHQNENSKRLINVANIDKIDEVFSKFNKKLDNSDFINFLNRDFKNTSFYKYFAMFNTSTIQKQNNIQLNFNITDKVDQFFEKMDNNIEKSKFFQFLNNFNSTKKFDENNQNQLLQKFENKLENSKLVDFLNRDFENSSFFKFLNNFNETLSFNRNDNKNADFLETSLISELKATPNEVKIDLKGLYVVSSFNLIALFAIILLIVYFLYLNKSSNNGRDTTNFSIAPSEMELMTN